MVSIPPLQSRHLVPRKLYVESLLYPRFPGKVVGKSSYYIPTGCWITRSRVFSYIYFIVVVYPDILFSLIFSLYIFSIAINKHPQADTFHIFVAHLAERKIGLSAQRQREMAVKILIIFTIKLPLLPIGFHELSAYTYII